MASLVALTALGPASAQAATFNVNDTRDIGEDSTTLGNGTCEAQRIETCTLRAAVEEANALAGTDRINVPNPGDDIYELTSGLSLDISSNVQIIGTSARDVIVRAYEDIDLPPFDRVFLIRSGATVTLRGLSIENGSPDQEDVGGDRGGNIYNEGTLRVIESTIIDGSAAQGGGIANNGGQLTVELSTLVDNRSGNASPNGLGGAIVDLPSKLIPDPLTIETSTISGNIAREGAGIFMNSGAALRIRNSTIAGNDAADRGGGLAFGSGAATIHSSIFAGNTSKADPTTPNCAIAEGSGIDSTGHNIETGRECGFTESTDQPATDPALGALENHGGQTDTHDLPATSPAIDTGDPAACPAADQRGFFRPQGKTCDVGAYERDQPPNTSFTQGPDGLTNDNTPTFAFTSTEPGGKPFEFECLLDAATEWVPCSSPLTLGTQSEGSHTLRVRAIDLTGNADPTPAVRSFTVDTTPPNTAINGGPNGPTNDATPTFSFNSPGDATATFQCSVDGGTFAVCTSPHTTGALTEGPHDIRVRALDAAGNIDASPAQRNFTVDLTAPNTAITGGPNGPTNDATPTFNFNSPGDATATFQCSVDGATFAVCTSPHTTGALTEGPHDIRVRALDAAGNIDASPAQRNFTVDLTAPNTAISGGPAGPTNDSTPTFSFNSPGDATATFQCSVDGATFAVCTSPHTTGALTEGPHDIRVRALDAAGNIDASPAQRNFTVDLTAPNTAITGGPNGPTNDATPTFDFNSPGDATATFQCSVDGGTFAVCTSPHTTGALTEGSHDIRVRALDAAGNIDASPAQRNFTVDLTPPDTSISGGPAGPTNDSTPTFNFNSPDATATFQCSIDGGGFNNCAAPFTTQTLSEGPHNIRVRARDAATNLDPTPPRRDFTVDLTPPDTTFTGGPVGPTNDATPTFDFDSPDATATFQCSIDGGGFNNCAAPFTTQTLSEGPHDIRVRARDLATNVDPTPPQRNFTVDVTPPDTAITGGPSGPTGDATPTFNFNSPDATATFQCSIDGGGFNNCAAPFTTQTLGEGAHNIRVRALDPAGNLDATPPRRDFTVDLTPPDTTITGGPNGSTGDATPTFDFDSPDATATFQCSIDGAAFAACTSAHTTPPLGDGPHTFDVRAVDPAGNQDQTPARNNIIVDTGPPDTAIDSGPDGLTNDSTPTFEFSSNESGVTFECRLDGGALATCPSPYTVNPLADGPHVLEVEAVDAVGNRDGSKSVRSFTVDTRAPETSILSGPDALTTDSTPTFEFSSDEDGSRFECQIDEGAFAECTSPFTTPTLSSGPHTFRVRAIDASGNVDSTPALGFDTTAAVLEFTLLGQEPGPPVLGESFNLEASSGEIFVSVPAPAGTARVQASQLPPGYESPIEGRVFVPLEEVRQLPVGSFVDTRFGTSRLTSARNSRGRTQAGKFSAGVFQVLQSRSRRAKGLTTLNLKGGSFNRCRSGRSRGSASAAQVARRTVRRVRSNANGRFRTRGRHSAATVRGTVWVTADRCDGTLTTVRRGSVAVRDFRRKRTVIVRAGQSYLARAPG